MRGRAFDELRRLAQGTVAAQDQIVRDQLATLYGLERVAQLSQQRAQDEGPQGALARSGGSLGKILSTRCTQLARDLGMRILGARGMLWAADRSPAGVVQELCLFSPAVSIYGGTDQIQRNILAERVLGLPRSE
jgi:alkylation response protein AidB-like acyl-CoA dehydrogenase